CTTHLEPSQWSIRVVSLCFPTAQALEDEKADTALRGAFAPGDPAPWTFHAAPFQCSMSGRRSAPTAWYPTAHAFVGDVAVTPARTLVVDPTFGLGSTVHEAPSQCSMIVLEFGPVARLPTAHASESDMAATADSTFWPWAFGLGWRVHAVPS